MMGKSPIMGSHGCVRRYHRTSENRDTGPIRAFRQRCEAIRRRKLEWASLKPMKGYPLVLLSRDCQGCASHLVRFASFRTGNGSKCALDDDVTEGKAEVA